jgi:hypothetical protein
MMDATNRKQEEIRLRAQNLIIRTERLVEQLEDWMPSVEANKNMIKEIKEREEKMQTVNLKGKYIPCERINLPKYI